MNGIYKSYAFLSKKKKKKFFFIFIVIKNNKKIFLRNQGKRKILNK